MPGATAADCRRDGHTLIEAACQVCSWDRWPSRPFSNLTVSGAVPEMRQYDTSPLNTDPVVCPVAGPSGKRHDRPWSAPLEFLPHDRLEFPPRQFWEIRAFGVAGKRLGGFIISAFPPPGRPARATTATPFCGPSFFFSAAGFWKSKPTMLQTSARTGMNGRSPRPNLFTIPPSLPTCAVVLDESATRQCSRCARLAISDMRSRALFEPNLPEPCARSRALCIRPQSS